MQYAFCHSPPPWSLVLRPQDLSFSLSIRDRDHPTRSCSGRTRSRADGLEAWLALAPRPKPLIERINSALVLAFLNILPGHAKIDHGFAQKTWLSLLLFATFLSLHPSSSTGSPMTSVASTSHPSDPHNVAELLPPRSSKSLLASTWQVLDQVFPSLLMFS